MDIKTAYLLFMGEKKALCADATVYYYDLNIKRFVEFVGAYTDVTLISDNTILKYITYLRDLGIKNTSVNTYMRALKIFCKWLLDEKYVDNDLVRKMKKLRDDAENVIPLYQNEVDRLDSFCELDSEIGLRNYIIFHLMLDAGLRSGEVLRLRVQDVHFDNQLLYVFGKGSKYRIVPLSDHLGYVIKTYLILFKNDAAPDAHIINLKKSGLDQVFFRMRNLTGIDRLHPHLLRHTFATSYICGGGNLEYLRLMLGHCDYAVTRRYLHLASQFRMFKADIYKLDKLFFETSY